MKKQINVFEQNPSVSMQSLTSPPLLILLPIQATSINITMPSA
jgi:hypothetical protein